MRPHAEYRALRGIKAEGSWAYAFQPGDDVTEDQRANLGLVVGEDVTPLSDNVMHRPADDDDRMEWQNYAVVRGMTVEEARTMDREELVAAVGNPPDASNGTVPLAPSASDRKALWAEFVAHRIVLDTRGEVDLGTARKRSNAATKDELVAAFGLDGTDDLRAAFMGSPMAPQSPKGTILPTGSAQEAAVPAPAAAPVDSGAVPVDSGAVADPAPDNTPEQAKTGTRTRAPKG